MKYAALALFAPLIAFAQANAASEEQESAGVWRSESPDGRYCCVIRRMPSNERIWDSSFDNSRLMIFPFADRKKDASLGELYFAFDEQGRLPAEVKWTADSKFFVFTTVSSGGHSPWHFTTYAFSVSDKKIVCVDDVIGPVVASDFKLEGAHTGTFKIDKKFPRGEHPEPLKLDISLLFSENPKEKIEQEGADQPATQPADKPQRLSVNLDQPTYWQGPKGERFVARYGSLSDDSLSFVKVTMPDGRRWTLPRAVSASGERYTDEREVVWWLHQGKVRVDVRRDDGEWEEARWTLRPDPQVD
jgi:membrane-bound inhibitor of C-type lysozyme